MRLEPDRSKPDARACWIAIVGLVAACAPTAPGRNSCKSHLQRGELVITEVFANPRPPAPEWFEIYNSTDRPIDLQGVTITHSRPDGSDAKSHTLTAATVGPHRYFTVGGAASADVDLSYGGDLGGFHAAGGGKIALDCGGVELAAAKYDHVRRGHSRELTAARPPDAALEADPASWCEANGNEFVAGSFGTPRAASDCVPLAVGACRDGMTIRDVVPPGVADLVITEVMPIPTKASRATGEWFEAKAMKDLDLNGVGLDRLGETTKPNVITATDCIHVTAGSYVVFAKSRDPAMNGGLPNVSGTFKFSLTEGSTARPGGVRIVVGKTVVDAITWTHSTPGAALQLDPDRTDAIANDDETNFCAATTPYGLGDLGTPGAANLKCASVPPPGMCFEAGAPRATVKPTGGQLVITEVMPRPTISPDEQWFEITNIGGAPFDLYELGLDRAGDTRPPDLILGTECKSVAPGAFAVFARSSAPATNGMLPAVDATFGFTMVETAGDVQVVDGSTVLDAVTWPTSTMGASTQLDPGAVTTTANDDPASFCPSTIPYGDGSNQGTPGAPNVACPARR